MTWLVIALTVTLAWQDNSNNENGFQIERALDCASYSVIGYTATDVSTFVDPASQYSACYRVLAFNDVGVSGYSNVAQVPPPPPPPCRPRGKSGKCR